MYHATSCSHPHFSHHNCNARSPWVECPCLFADIANHIVFNSFLSSTYLLNISLTPVHFMDIRNSEIKFFLYSTLTSTNILMILYTISLLKLSPSHLLLSFYYFSINSPSPHINYLEKPAPWPPLGPIICCT